jgi:hypothetical protein
VLGRDPITDDPVPQDAGALIGGFMKLIGQQEVYENLKKSNALGRATAWFKSALGELLGFVREFPSLFLQALRDLTIEDIILLPMAFVKVGRVFGSFAGRFISWALSKVLSLLEIIFDVLAPSVTPYLRKAAGAFKTIIQNPIGFVGNLVKAAMLGFRNFGSNIGAHLKAALIDWLTGSLPGVYIPKSFELGELVKFVLSVLGISWQNVRAKLVKVVGETAVKAMETGFDIVVTLVKDGPAAAWDKIKEQLGNLRDMVVNGIIDMVIDMVAKKAVPKIVAMFIPGAGFISAILSIVDTVQVFVSKLSKIGQVVASFIDSIASIAGGAVAGAAKRVESTLAGLLSLAISFLAGFAGLGKVADKVMGVINKVRATIDKALDALINWIVAMAKKLGRFIMGGAAGSGDDTRTPEEKQRNLQEAMATAVQEARRPGASRREINRILQQLKTRYRLRALAAEAMGRDRWRIHGMINPEVYSEPLPDRMTEEEAVAALQQRSPEIRVASLAIAYRVIQRVFGGLALETPEPGPGAGPSERVTTSGGKTKFEGGYTTQNEAMKSFRTMKESLLVFHVDVKKFNVAEIAAWFQQERRSLSTGIDTANANMRRQLESPNPNNSIINTLTANLNSFRNRLQELGRLEASFNASLPAYKKLEKEGVLYGHQGNLTEGHPHRRVPHINLEGRIYFGTSAMEYIDATIYIAP